MHTTQRAATHLRSPKSPRPGMMYAFSFRPWSIQPVICEVCRGDAQHSAHPNRALESLTTRVCGYVVQKFFSPSGDAICHRACPSVSLRPHIPRSRTTLASAHHRCPSPPCPHPKAHNSARASEPRRRRARPGSVRRSSKSEKGSGESVQV